MIWSIPPGRNLRRAHEGGWIIDALDVFSRCTKEAMLRRLYPECEQYVARLIRVEMRRRRQRRAPRNRG